MIGRSRVRLPVVALAIGAFSCKPDIDSRTSLVQTRQILAVRAEPAEAAPGAPVTFSALVVDAAGPADAPLAWAYCDERKPLAELGPVSPKCLLPEGDFFEPIGIGAQATGPIPAKACRQFGPEVPDVPPGEPPGRPVDPDPTGGYYQPTRVGLAGDESATTIARVRIRCGVVGPSPDQLAELNAKNHPNVNPAFDAVTPLVEDGNGPPLSVHPGDRVALHATWASCEGGASACTGAEAYAVYDVATRSVVDRREAMRVSWFATDGTFDEDRTGRAEGDAVASSDDAWVAPPTPGTVHLWTVLRDDRGGVGWKAFTIDVR